MCHQLPAPPGRIAEAVNEDIVEATVELFGYSRSVWALAFATTTAACGVVDGCIWRFVDHGAPLAIGGLVVTGMIAAYLVRLGMNWQLQTLAVRNALERRLGVPETARHRHNYHDAYTEWEPE